MSAQYGSKATIDVGGTEFTRVQGWTMNLAYDYGDGIRDNETGQFPERPADPPGDLTGTITLTLEDNALDSELAAAINGGAGLLMAFYLDGGTTPIWEGTFVFPGTNQTVAVGQSEPLTYELDIAFSSTDANRTPTVGDA